MDYEQMQLNIEFLRLIELTDDQIKQVLKIVYTRIDILETELDLLKSENKLIRLKVKKLRDGKAE